MRLTILALRSPGKVHALTAPVCRVVVRLELDELREGGSAVGGRAGELPVVGVQQLLIVLLQKYMLSARRGHIGYSWVFDRVSSGHGSDRSASPKIVTGPKILTMVYGTTSNLPLFDLS